MNTGFAGDMQDVDSALRSTMQTPPCSSGQLPAAIAGFALVANGDDPDEVFRRRVCVERNVARFPVGDDEFPQCGAGSGRAADLWVRFQDEYGAAYRVDVSQGGGRVALMIEFENLLQVVEGLFGEDDHAVLRAFGRTGFPPLARASRYANTSVAGMLLPDFFMRANLRCASA